MIYGWEIYAWEIGEEVIENGVQQAIYGEESGVMVIGNVARENGE